MIDILQIRGGSDLIQQMNQVSSIAENMFAEIGESFTATAGQTQFTLTHTPNSSPIVVGVNGLDYYENVSFTANRLAKTVTWTDSYTLEAGDNVYITYTTLSNNLNGFGVQLAIQETAGGALKLVVDGVEYPLTAPTNVSDLVNDAGYLTSSDIANLVNGLGFEVVNALPTQDIDTNKIYLVRNSDSTGDDLYTEYLRLNDSWEILGSRRLDLSSYLTANDISFQVATAQSQITAIDGSVIGVGDNALYVTVGNNQYAVLLSRSNVADELLTGYTVGSSTADVAATDSIKQAIAKLENRIKVIEQTAVFNTGS